MKKSSLIITFIFGFNTLVQLITQIFITRLIGAKLDLDLFLMASAIPTMIITVIYGTLNDAFAPRLGKHINEKDNISYLLSHVFSLSLFSFLFALILILFSPLITSFFYPTLHGINKKFTEISMSAMFLTIPFGVIATLFGSYYYLKGKLYRFPFAQFLGGLSQLLIIWFFYKNIGIGSLVVGFVISIVIQVLFITIPNKNIINNFSYKLIYPKNLLLSWIPLMLGNLFLRSDTLLVRSFGSHLDEGSLVYLNLASRMFALSAGIITIGIQVTVFPHFIKLFHAKKNKELKLYVSKAKKWSTLVTLLVVVTLSFLAPFIIKILFTGGKFTHSDSIKSASLIPLFILPAIGWGIAPVFLLPLSAVNKQYLSGRIQVIGGILGWISAYISNYFLSPSLSISIGLTVLLFIIILGSHQEWIKIEKNL